MIVMGLYVFLWAKSKEEFKDDCLEQIEEITSPLLQNHPPQVPKFIP